MIESIDKEMINTVTDRINKSTDINEIREVALAVIDLLDKFNRLSTLESEKANAYKHVALALVKAFEDTDEVMGGALSKVPSYTQMIGNTRAVLEQ